MILNATNYLCTYLTKLHQIFSISKNMSGNDLTLIRIAVA